jgi:O-acetyl-ADP-ribose deacetylase (regulator of RNase III)
MIEQQIDILSDELIYNADCICFTSNGVIKSDGTLTMGKGVAGAFKSKWPMIPRYAGECVKANGNICQVVYVLPPDDGGSKDDRLTIVAFPTKHHYRNPSDIELIKQSALQLVALTNDKGWRRVYLPFPGTGCGGLNKEDVRAVLSLILDDRFIITTL